MSDMREAFDALKEHNRERRAEAREAGVKAIRELATRGYEVKELTEYQFRVNGVVDLYPVHRRFHELKTGRRGVYDRHWPAAIVHEAMRRATRGRR